MDESILDPDPHPDQLQNLIDWSLVEVLSFHRIWFKSLSYFLRWLTQTAIYHSISACRWEVKILSMTIVRNNQTDDAWQFTPCSVLQNVYQRRWFQMMPSRHIIHRSAAWRRSGSRTEEQSSERWSARSSSSSSSRHSRLDRRQHQSHCKSTAREAQQQRTDQRRIKTSSRRIKTCTTAVRTADCVEFSSR